MVWTPSVDFPATGFALGVASEVALMGANPLAMGLGPFSVGSSGAGLSLD